MRNIKNYPTEADFSANEPAGTSTWNFGPINENGTTYAQATLVDNGPDNPMQYTVTINGDAHTFETPYSAISAGGSKVVTFSPNNEIIFLDFVSGNTGVTEDQGNDIRYEWFDGSCNYMGQNFPLYVLTRATSLSDPTDVLCETPNDNMFWGWGDSAFTDFRGVSEVMFIRFTDKVTPINEYVTSIEPGMAYVKQSGRVAFNEIPAPPTPPAASAIKLVFGGWENDGYVGEAPKYIWTSTTFSEEYNSLSVPCSVIEAFVDSAITSYMDGIESWSNYFGQFHVVDENSGFTFSGAPIDFGPFRLTDRRSAKWNGDSDCDLVSWYFYNNDIGGSYYNVDNESFSQALEGKTLIFRVYYNGNQNY